jgi:hypothetical protein
MSRSGERAVGVVLCCTLLLQNLLCCHLVCLQTLLSRFWFEVHPDMGTAEEVEAETEVALVLVPGRPLKMKVTPHSL